MRFGHTTEPNATGWSERMRIDTTGNVGIGTVAPGQKLDVNGYVKGSGLCNGTDCKTAWSQVGGAKCKKKIIPAGSTISCDNSCAADGLICVHAEWPPRSSPYVCLYNVTSDGLFYCVCCPQ